MSFSVRKSSQQAVRTLSHHSASKTTCKSSILVQVSMSGVHMKRPTLSQAARSITPLSRIQSLTLHPASEFTDESSVHVPNPTQSDASNMIQSLTPHPVSSQTSRLYMYRNPPSQMPQTSSKSQSLQPWVHWRVVWTCTTLRSVRLSVGLDVGDAAGCSERQALSTSHS